MTALSKISALSKMSGSVSVFTSTIVWLLPPKSYHFELQKPKRDSHWEDNSHFAWIVPNLSAAMQPCALH